ncbi:MAG: hypothetical protein ACK5T6_07395, partial [Pirellula sp.]
SRRDLHQKMWYCSHGSQLLDGAMIDSSNHNPCRRGGHLTGQRGVDRPVLMQQRHLRAFSNFHLALPQAFCWIERLGCRKFTLLCRI